MSNEGWARPVWAMKNHWLAGFAGHDAGRRVRHILCWSAITCWTTAPLLSPQPADDDPANCRQCRKVLVRRHKDAR